MTLQEPSRPIDAVLFDVDGTLVDSLEMIVAGLADTFEHFDDVRIPHNELRPLIGLPLTRQVGYFLPTQLSESARQERISFAMARFDARKQLVREFEPAVDALRICHLQGIRTALVTSKNAEELRDFHTRFSASDAVDATVCSSDVRHPKPYPDSALLACQRLGVQPNRAVFIGDSIFDAQCARAAGVPFMAALYGAGSEGELLAEAHVRAFRTPSDLLSWAQLELHPKPCLAKS